MTANDAFQNDCQEYGFVVTVNMIKTPFSDGCQEYIFRIIANYVYFP